MEMVTRDLVSIVVPVYNSASYLTRCIDSLCSQSYPYLEIILVDDGSQDHSLEICRHAMESDPRIQVIHQENRGAAGARNAGMERMSGQWLLLIDGDDYIHRDMVRDLLKAARACHGQTAICGFERVYAASDAGSRENRAGKNGDGRLEEAGARREVHALSGPVWQGDLHEFSERMLLLLFRNLMLRTQSNKLYKTELIQKHHLRYPEGISINEDIWFCVRYLTFCERIACIPGSYLYYWQNTEGESLIGRYHPEGVESCFLLLAAMEEFLKAAGSSRRVRQEMDNEMLFHICGFAGHSYSRSGKGAGECLEEIRGLAERREMRALLSRIKPRGLKNQVACFLLRHRWCTAYHWLCMGVYGRWRPGRGIRPGQTAVQSGQGRQRRAWKSIGGNENQCQEACVMTETEKDAQVMVSISCITFNHEPYIARALDSFLMQKTSFPIEILVYDDASTDRTQEIIREYERKYPDVIKPYYQTENQYSKGKYNVEGFYNYPRAKGKYIAMCDGDDYWIDERKLQLQVDYMEAHPECAMCLHSARIETAEAAIQPLHIRPYRKDCQIPAEGVIDKPSNYPTASLLFRTEYTRDLQDYYYVSPVGDIPIQIHMASKGTVYYMDREMSVYRQGVSVSWSALMKQGDYKQNLIDHHNAMKVMYRGFSKETGGRYDRAIQRACRRMDFLTLLNVKEYDAVLAPSYRSFYRELDLRTRFFIRFERLLPGLYRGLRKLVFGKDRC